MDLVQNRFLPLNPVSTAGPFGSPNGKGNSTQTADHRKWVSDVCGSQRMKKYEESAFWGGDMDKFPITENRKSLYDLLKAD